MDINWLAWKGSARARLPSNQSLLEISVLSNFVVDKFWCLNRAMSSVKCFVGVTSFVVVCLRLFYAWLNSINFVISHITMSLMNFQVFRRASNERPFDGNWTTTREQTWHFQERSDIPRIKNHSPRYWTRFDIRVYFDVISKFIIISQVYEWGFKTRIIHWKLLKSWARAVFVALLVTSGKFSWISNPDESFFSLFQTTFAPSCFSLLSENQRNLHRD